MPVRANQRILSSPDSKNIPLSPLLKINSIDLPVSPPEGRLAIVTDAGVALGVTPQANIFAGILAGGRHGQPAKVMCPTLGMAGPLRWVGKTAVGHAQPGAAGPVDQVDLEQTRSRRHFVIPVPSEAG